MKLTADGARLVRQLAIEGLSVKEIAALFRVHWNTVYFVLTVRTWRDVAPELQERARATLRKKTTLTKEQITELRTAHAAGASRQDLARRFAICEGYTRRLLKAA